MANLTSPGVSVLVSDESAYASAGAGTIPLLVLATREDKTDPTGTYSDDIAIYSKAAFAGQVVSVTSQRELTQYFGLPTFRKDNNAIVEGDETHEYGLLAAYSFLGQGSQAYVVRANIDLTKLEPKSDQPVGPATLGTLWLDTNASKYGIHVYNGSRWEEKTPLVQVSKFSGTDESLVEAVLEPTINVQIGKYLVLVSIASTGMTLRYFVGENVVAESVSTPTWVKLDENYSGGMVTYDKHYNAPLVPTSNDIWIKTTTPSNGVNIQLYIADIFGEFNPVTVQGISTNYNSAFPALATFVNQDGTRVTNISSLSNGNAQLASYSSARDGEVTFNTVTETVNKVGHGYSNDMIVKFNNIVSTTGISENTLYYVKAATADTFQLSETSGGVTIPLVSNGANPSAQISRVRDNYRLELLYTLSNLAEQIDDTYTVVAQATQPTGIPTDGDMWYSTNKTNLDIVTRDSTGWTRVVANKIVYSVIKPSTKSDGSALSADDVWVDLSAAERDYPSMYRYSNGVWEKHDNTDQSTEFGVIFDDFFPISNNLLPGAPNYQLYPEGMLAINMCRSGNTIRDYNSSRASSWNWRNAAPNHADGSGAFGRFAQRKIIANAMQAAISGNDALREPIYPFTVLCAPNYPELTDELVTLNTDRGETGFIIIDTPMHKNPTEVVTWAQGNNATENGQDGLVTKNTYSAVYYPAIRTTTPSGDTVTAPPSHAVIYQIAYNDSIAYPWFAAAGLTRGSVRNGSAAGYIGLEGEFKSISLSQGQRDSLYVNSINPIATFPSEGVVIFGNKSLHPFASALDRVNVGRLVAYLRERFEIIGRPFLFEPNDKPTRDRVAAVYENFLLDILAKRGVTDFFVLCSEENNTPARIDRNELWIEIGIIPTKSTEFIYIPLRILNTGAI
jgi:hypothetical protein